MSMLDTLEQMQVKSWLNQARPESEIAQLETSVKRLRDYQAKAGLKLDGVERYAGLVAEYVGELQARADAVAAVIESVPDERQCGVLTNRYLNGWTWEQIAEQMSYCTVNLHRIHRTALSSVKVILEAQDEAAAPMKERKDC